MIRINDRYEIKNILLKRSKLQEKYVNAMVDTAAIHEHNYIHKKKKADNKLTIWYFLLVGYILMLAFFYLYEIIKKDYGIIIIAVVGVALFGFLVFVLSLFKKTKQLKNDWELDKAKDKYILDEANAQGKLAATLAIQIMAITDHMYMVDYNGEDRVIKWQIILYEYVDAINQYYNGANIEDYIEYYKKWELEYYKKV